MSNFNEYFRKTALPLIMRRFYSSVDSYSTSHKITKLNYELEKTSPKPASYFIENGLTANHRVLITYEMDNKPTQYYSEFSIPKEIDGAFIIDGRYRIPTNKLANSYECRIKTSDFGKGDKMVKFDYNHEYLIDRKILRIRHYDIDTGVKSRPTEIPYDKIDESINDPEKREMLKLTDNQQKKLIIKLDLDYVPEYINTKIIDECIAFGDDKVHDFIIDKEINSVSQSFMQFLFEDGNGKNFKTASKIMKTYFAREGKLLEENSTITNLATKFWRGGMIQTLDDKTATELTVPPGVNAINLESIKSKITFPSSCAYNPTYSDLIDVGDTPNNQNISLLNSLTVATHLTDDGILYDVYDKDFNKITIKYIDYLLKKVCSSEYIDYDTKTLKPNENGEVEVKHRMRRKMVPVGEVELIDLPPDYRLSSTVRRIPFVNFTDSVRISMGSSMLKQAIPLPNAQRPLVDSGNYEDLKDNVLNEKFRYPEGKVVDINEDDVVIELPDKKIVKVARRTGIQSLNDVTVFTEPKVKVGQKVKEGDIICGPHEIDGDTVKTGVNTTVLFHAYNGLVHEDAVVVSESYADRMACYQLIDISIDVKNLSAIKWMAPIGTPVKYKDVVVTLLKTNRLDKLNQAINDKFGIEDDAAMNGLLTEQYLTVPNNIEDAVVSDILVQENIDRLAKKSKNIKTPDYSWSLSSAKVIKEYEKNKDRQVIYDNYPEYIASDTLDPINLDEKTYKVVYTIRVRLIKRQRLVVGSKITNRYGGKGVVSAIEPDEKMPILVDSEGNQKRVEIVMNPYSTINRKIPSVIYEAAMANCCIKIHDNVEKWKSTAAGRKKIMPMINKYYPGKYDKMTVEQFIKLHDSSPLEEVYSMKVGSFSTVTPEKIQSMMKDLNVSTQSKVLMPKLNLCDLDEIKETMSDEEYNKFLEDNRGKFEEVDKPLMAGSITMEQLYHMPMYSNKVTSDMQPQNPKIEPISGRGNYRKTGQIIGEYELWALLSRGNRKFIQSARKDSEVRQNQEFLDNLLGLGIIVTDSKGYAQGGSNLKNQLNKMKTKYRFRNGEK